MKNRLNQTFTLRVWHVAVIFTTLSLLIMTGAAVWAQGGESRRDLSPEILFRPGTVRLAAANFTSPLSFTCDDTFQTAASLSIKIPAGKRADVITTANAEVDQQLSSGKYAYGKFNLDNTTDLAPSSNNGMWVVDGDGPRYPTLYQQGMTTFPVGSGNHVLTYVIRCTGGSLVLQDTILAATVNIR